MFQPEHAGAALDVRHDGVADEGVDERVDHRDDHGSVLVPEAHLFHARFLPREFVVAEKDFGETGAMFLIAEEAFVRGLNPKLHRATARAVAAAVVHECIHRPADGEQRGEHADDDQRNWNRDESPELHFSAPFREVAPAQLLPQQRERHAEE